MSWKEWTACIALLAASAGAASASEPPQRTVSLAGSATVKAPPDKATVHFAIETRCSVGGSKMRDYVVGTAETLKVSAPMLAECQAAGEQAVKRVREALKALGIEEKQVQTESFQVEPQAWGDDGFLFFRGYLCRHVMSLTLKDVSKVDACVDGVLRSGATHIVSVSFDTTQLRKHRDEARKLACKAAREKADLLAGELGAKVKRVLSVNEGEAGVWCGKNWGGGRQQRFSQNVVQDSELLESRAGGEGAEELAAGEVAIQASVSVVFELE